MKFYEARNFLFYIIPAVAFKTKKILY